MALLASDVLVWIAGCPGVADNGFLLNVDAEAVSMPVDDASGSVTPTGAGVTVVDLR